MKCTLNGASTRVFAKAVQSLSKFGSDLFMEADVGGMRLRSLNSNRSAVGTIRFDKSFFEDYRVNAGHECYCKISMKACLTVFRSTRLVERCDMSFETATEKFQVQLKCRLETVRNAAISIVDEENITADVPVSNFRNTIGGSHKIFTEMSNNFNASEEEITLEVQDKCLVIKNYVEGSRVNEKFMRSQLKLTSDEFETYKVDQEASITFCLKEFRAWLQFAETLNENLILQFNEAGSPVFLHVKRFDEIDCLLIMSTLSPEDVSFYEECRQSEVLEDPNINFAQKRKLKNTTVKGANEPPKARRCHPEDTTLSNDSSLFRFGGTSSAGTSSSGCQSIAVPRNNVGKNVAATIQSDELFPAMLNSEHRNLPDAKQKRQSEVPVLFCDTEEDPSSEVVALADDLDCIPQSPPREQGTQLRSIFSRCFEATYVPKEPSGGSQIYAPNSDTES